MAIATAADLFDLVRRSQVLESKQLNEAAQLATQLTDPKEWATEIIRKGWVTGWQITQIGKGKGAGLLLGGYVLLQLIGEGGMGQVFKARQVKLRRLAALKVIRKEYLTSPAAVERFQREAEAAARLSHPNIVTVYDAGEVNSTHFLAMEYIDGQDLSRVVKDRGQLPAGEACEYIRQAALGLQHAHEQGLVHRDIKPSNLMLTTKGVVKLMDLGLARLNPVAGGSAATGLTASGAVMGTPDYIAPEQAMNAKHVDIRADIYSLGCSLYFLLTGRSPFTGESLTEKLLKHQLEEPEAAEKLRTDLPKKLPAVLRKMMAKKPEKRHQTPDEVAAALEPFAAKLAPATMTTAVAGPRVADNRETLSDVRSEPLPRTVPFSEATPVLERKGGRKVVVLGGLAAALACLVGMAVLFAVLGGSGTQQSNVVQGSTSGNANLATSLGAPTARRETKIASKPSEPPVEPKPLPGKEYITNSIGMKLVKIPQGKFTMGSPPEEREQRDNEGPQHEVEITRPFYMGIYEVTQDEYEQVMKANPSQFKVVAGHDTKRFPVDYVAWTEATEFCRKFSDLPDEKRAGRIYRLPTEAEWECACRADTKTAFHFGNSLSSTQANYNGTAPYGADKGPNLQRPTTVGTYPPNAYGLYDMHGNVLEWCNDWFGPYSKDSQKDPQGPQTGQQRLLRGGAWTTHGAYCRAAIRFYGDPGDRYSILGCGFRVVIAPRTP